MRFNTTIIASKLGMRFNTTKYTTNIASKLGMRFNTTNIVSKL